MIFFTLLLLLKNWNKLEGNSKSAMHSSLNFMLSCAWKNIHLAAHLTGKEHKDVAFGKYISSFCLAMSPLVLDVNSWFLFEQ